MKFAITASPDILGVVGPHHVARNFGNTLCQIFRQQLYKLDRKTNNTLVLFGNILILEWCIINKELALLILTVLMMVAQLSRLYYAKN